MDEIDFYNPFDETHPIKFNPKDKNAGPGYYRVPSLVSLWSSAPFLHNNMLGKFTGDPSWQAVSTRLMMQWKNCSGRRNGWAKHRSGERKTNAHYICGRNFVRQTASSICGHDGYIKTGSIPKDTPMNLVANLEPDFQHIDVFRKIAEKLIKLKAVKLSRDEAAAELNQLIPDLRGEQMSRLRRRQRTLFRHGPAGFRQARADRILENLLAR